jgi:predicted amidophosphoribosyltransferase
MVHKRKKKCPYCGSILLSDDNFCHVCLNEVHEDEVELAEGENY